MRSIISAAFIYLFAFASFAQKKDSVSTDKDGIYYVAQLMPEFKGGQQALYKFMGDSINYPERAREKKIKGKCIARFVVDSLGKVGRVEIVQGIKKCPECDAEVVRVLKLLPDFNPGKVNDRTVSVWYQLPVNFKVY